MKGRKRLPAFAVLCATPQSDFLGVPIKPKSGYEAALLHLVHWVISDGIGAWRLNLLRTTEAA